MSGNTTLPTALKIMLPWPPKELNPNARVHWTKKSSIGKKYRADCYYLTRTHRPKFPLGKIHLSIVFFPPDKRRRDLDNMLSSCKFALDALAEAWGVDDSRFWLSLDINDPVKHGAVSVEVRP